MSEPEVIECSWSTGVTASDIMHKIISNADFPPGLLMIGDVDLTNFTATVKVGPHTWERYKL